MKFGQDLHLHQVPEWEPFYIHYRQLKRGLKSAVQKAFRSGTEPSFADLYAFLSRDIDAFNKFYNDKHDFLLQEERQTRLRYGIEACTSAIPDLEKVDDYELNALTEDILELQQDLQKLQWFNRVNQHAIDKMFTKLEKPSEGVGQSHYDQKSRWLKSQLACETQLLKDAERLNKLAEDVRLAGSRMHSGSSCKSLYLENLCRQQSACSHAAYGAIRADQVSDLAKLLEQKPANDETHRSQPQEFLYGLLMFSMTCQSRGCMSFLLTEKLPKIGVAMDHICLNHLIITTGRKNLPAHRDFSKACTPPIADQIHSEMGTSMLIAMLEQLGSSKKGVLLAEDGLGRLPLHYGALYGLSAVCQSILNSLGRDPPAASDAVLSVDSAGYTPLHYAVIRRHEEVARLFLDTLNKNYENGDEARNQHLGNLLGGLLLVALKYQYDDIVHLFISSRIDTSCHRSGCGETALYVAVQIGCEDYVKMLLEATPRRNANINVFETVYGRTPLLTACAEGHQAVVEHLLQAGASQSIVDHQGWTAREHAAFRGHLAVAQMLETCKTGYGIGNLVKMPIKTAANTKHHLRAGHSHIVANLGVMQKGKQVAAVNLSCYSSDYIHGMHTDTRFSIEVSVPGESGPSRLVQLPILDDMTNDPFVFSIKDATEAKLMFKVFCATSTLGKKGILVGSGTALLENHQHCFGANRDSLIRERTIPILEKDTLNFMGTVTFTFVLAKPFMHLQPPPLVKFPIKDAGPVQLVGHRGLGQNVSSHKRLQLGENTIESFLSAAKLGAPFVEFGNPPVAQAVWFIYASRVQSPRGDPVSVLGKPTLQTSWPESSPGERRSQSLTRKLECGAEEVRDRMKYTVDFTKRGFKPNTRGDFIQGSFATLQELLVKLPKSISFDIEIKYPRLHEAVDACVAPIAIELNTFIDTTLNRICRFAGDRTIILSSFTPEVCILLTIKQQSYPVMFITNAGKRPITDMEIRAGSLQVAVHFAKKWNLSGIIFASETLILCPRLIEYVKSSGLSCGSYGSLNNIPENAILQAEAGLDLIVADRVGLISKTLKSVSV